MKAKRENQTNMIYYISDLHIGDDKTCKKCKRDFIDNEQMKEVISTNWNIKVKDNDHVYILGDIAENFDNETILFFKNLKGRKHLIVGNHDEPILEEIRNANLFESIKFIDLISDEGRNVCICHYPLMDWTEFNRGGYLVYGHIHNKTEENGEAYKQIKEYYKNKLAYNCGVDVVEFQPVTLDEMIKLKEENKNEAFIN